MKTAVAVALLLLPGTNFSQQSAGDDGLPELHKIKIVTLSPSYSCRSREDLQRGYENTALFLSRAAKRQNAPELLFDGACQGEDYLEVNTAGHSISVLADLGEIPLENLRATQVLNTRRVNRTEYYSRFASVAKPIQGHTYAVLINNGHARGFFYFTITAYVPSQKLGLKYAVKDYQLVTASARADGFDWEKVNHE